MRMDSMATEFQVSEVDAKFDGKTGELAIRIPGEGKIKAQVMCTGAEIMSKNNEPQLVWLPNGTVIQQMPEADVEICVRFAVRHDEDCPFKPILLCVEKEE